MLEHEVGVLVKARALHKYRTPTVGLRHEGLQIGGLECPVERLQLGPEPRERDAGRDPRSADDHQSPQGRSLASAAMRPSALAPLGNTALTVTRLGLGSASLGGMFTPVDEQDGRDVVELAWQLGLRFFDTAPLYACGEAERRVGHVLAGKARDEFVLATKVGRLLRHDPASAEGRVELVFDFSYDGVLRSVEESLERLGLDRLDVLHIHDPEDYPVDVLAEAYPALDRLRSEGTVRAVGAGMNHADPLVRLAREADFDCFLLAGRYTLLDQSGLDELLPLCERNGIAVIVGGVYNSGILGGLQAGATFDYAPAPREVIDRVRRLDEVCARHGVPLKAAAIQFPLGHPAVVAVLAGSRSVAELEECVRVFEAPIPSALWEELRAEGLLGADVPAPTESA